MILGRLESATLHPVFSRPGAGLDWIRVVPGNVSGMKIAPLWHLTRSLNTPKLAQKQVSEPTPLPKALAAASQPECFPPVPSHGGLGWG